MIDFSGKLLYNVGSEKLRFAAGQREKVNSTGGGKGDRHDGLYSKSNGRIFFG